MRPKHVRPFIIRTLVVLMPGLFLVVEVAGKWRP